jgi:cation-transporting P-type ATPase E
MLDISNIKVTVTALGIGAVGAVFVEVIWWIQGAVLGEPRRLWRAL